MFQSASLSHVSKQINPLPSPAIAAWTRSRWITDSNWSNQILSQEICNQSYLGSWPRKWWHKGKAGRDVWPTCRCTEKAGLQRAADAQRAAELGSPVVPKEGSGVVAWRSGAFQVLVCPTKVLLSFLLLGTYTSYLSSNKLLFQFKVTWFLFLLKPNMQSRNVWPSIYPSFLLMFPSGIFFIDPVQFLFSSFLNIS